VETAVPVSEDDGSWQVLPSGRKFSHDWGYGKVDLQLISSHRIATEQTAITLGDVLMYSQPWRVKPGPRRGDLSVELRSPAGIVSYLSVARRKDDMPVGYDN
jgi:kexin